MNLLKKIVLVFKSKADKAIDQLLTAKMLSESTISEIDDSLYKLIKNLEAIEESQLKIKSSNDSYASSLFDIEEKIKQESNAVEIKRLAKKALQIKRVIEIQLSAISRIEGVKIEIKNKIIQLHDYRNEVESTCEVLKIEHETYSTLNNLAVDDGLISIGNDSLKRLREISEKTRYEYEAKLEVKQFTDSVSHKPVVSSSNEKELEEYIKSLKS
jgi:hypothetical protein